jgi:hypothetical protein
VSLLHIKKWFLDEGKSAHNHIFPDELLEVVSKVKSDAVVDPGERDGVKSHTAQLPLGTLPIGSWPPKLLLDLPMLS